MRENDGWRQIPAHDYDKMPVTLIFFWQTDLITNTSNLRKKKKLLNITSTLLYFLYLCKYFGYKKEIILIKGLMRKLDIQISCYSTTVDKYFSGS